MKEAMRLDRARRAFFDSKRLARSRWLARP